MRYAIYGSLGLAGHAIDALRREGGSDIVLVVDEENRIGEAIAGHQVQPPANLRNASFDRIIVATMAYARAIKQIYALGYTAAHICDEVWWDPFFLQLEPTTRCNFSCRNCSRKDLPPERKNQDIPLRDFARILEESPTLKRLQLQGLGEPLLNPKLSTMLKMARKRGIGTSLTTNGALLNKELGKLLAAYIDKLVISLDAVEEELFSQLRRGGSWRQVRANIETFLSLNAKTAVVYNCVVSSSNLTAIESILRCALETRPNEVHLQLAENWYIPRQAEFNTAHQQALQDAQKEKEILAIISKWRQPLQKKRINLTYTGADKRKGFCWWPFFGMFVAVDGYVTPCCIRMQPEVFHLGNIFRQTLVETWHGTAYRNFRKSMFQNRDNNVCDHCPL